MKRPLLAGVLLVAAIAAGLLVSAALNGGGGDSGGQAAAPAVRGFPAAKTSPSGQKFSATSAQAKLAPGVSIVARARSQAVRLYRHAGSPHAYRTLRARRVERQRVPLAFLVRARKPGWVKVSLPARPNLSQAWVRRRDLRLAATRMHLRVELGRHRLVAFAGKRRVLTTKVALGKSITPTPKGEYFVSDVFRPPDPRGFYGPWALGLSAHSPVLTSFAGGDGQIGIHGTNNPSVLGSSVSHGCIRIANRAVTKLAHTVPLGAPVEIVA